MILSRYAGLDGELCHTQPDIFFSIVLINTDLRPTFSELAARRTVFYLLTCGSDWRGQVKLINGVIGIDKMQIDNIIVAE